MSQQAYIVAGYRTAVGKAPRGVFRFTRPDDLAAEVIKHLVKSPCPRSTPRGWTTSLSATPCPRPSRACKWAGSSRYWPCPSTCPASS